ncbi:methionine synthase [Gluconobacter wancherniae]|uniref:Methionine synthase n=1 Tax=Gluconobacter wancherniae NBRC 103581 TaxID=656744 RepID=A0A511B2C1_9PROT|nr:methionine synthase [Gluconobacter wancherniae]MBF0854783.1 methionine synthase [Gluconobacter wancherniae]GBD57854.1 methionine synthase [Gluconobacter wancherniae NBRC 103581]GBR61924.1 methionine synthase [Gluconobacter wancherniae NBRC 103581]GEK94619.1 methionine synthase [Gluconobacter wancherniae NBRC 103581]
MSSRPHLLDALSDQVLLCDGGMGSRVQMLDLEVERDYWGQENCTEILNLSRPELVREIHRGYFEAGADMVETNTFGGSILTLAEFDLQDRTREINRIAAGLAREAAETFSDDRHRYVMGSIGPGTKLPTLGNVDYDTLEAAITEQCRGLIDGGVDGFLIETCQDTLQIKAAVNAAKLARIELGSDAPIFVQVTVETTGTLLVGPDIAAAATAIHALDVPSLGLNCATGPQEMAEHVRWLSENWPGLISIQPNAGLPELVDGSTFYPLSPDEMAVWMERFIIEDGLNLIGGCCGTSTPHIQGLDAMLRRRGGARLRPAPVSRKPVWIPSVSSLYSQTPLRQENSYFSIGERCNANGSKKWRELQEAGDWDGCVAVGREQAAEGSNSLDVCTAFVGRDEVAEMSEVITRFTSSVNAPLVIDSTETPVIEAALKLHGGKPIINSINFEDGEQHAHDRMKLAKKFGAAMIALTIDEVGMAKMPEDKLRIAERLVDFACNQYGLPQSDLMIDPLTFTIATGMEDDRKLGAWTLEGIRLIREKFPDIQIILGLSNISFGLNPAARAVLNSVFLDHAVKAGMTGAIVHVSKIRPLHLIAAEEVKVAEDLIYDRRTPDYDPLQKLLELFAGRKAADAVKKRRAETPAERLKERIVDGERKGIEEDLEAAMKEMTALDIINNVLLDGMKVVGELFGSGKMQLPFVLQSAETMKTAVAWLEPHMERVEGQHRGTMVLATVKGDVHDIGKNLVDIILTNNGYQVINLGIKVPLADMIAAAKEHNAHAIGMSGLLVKSTVIMRENLEEMKRQGIDLPVILGGAALTRNYVEEECARAYGGGEPGRVAYARDAFDGLSLMDKVAHQGFDEYLTAIQTKRAGKSGRKNARAPEIAETRGFESIDPAAARERRARIAGTITPPTPPFWGPRLVESVPNAVLPFLNERSLYQFQWGFRKQGRSLEEFMEYAKTELRPVLKRMLALNAEQDILRPQALYGYWKAAGDGNDLVLFEEDGTTEAARFTLPRQPKEDGECIADFVRDINDDVRDVVGLQIVTVGQKASDLAREWFEENRYQDYLYLHGLSVEMAEAMAEYTHKRIRAELGYAAEDDRDMEKMLSQSYRGSRYSFGYPACPRLEDQEPILRLLGAERIGVSLSDGYQLHPEQSTSALVILNPRAKYFTV